MFCLACAPFGLIGASFLAAPPLPLSDFIRLLPWCLALPAHLTVTRGRLSLTCLFHRIFALVSHLACTARAPSGPSVAPFVDYPPWSVFYRLSPWYLSLAALRCRFWTDFRPSVVFYPCAFRGLPSLVYFRRFLSWCRALPVRSLAAQVLL